MSAPSRLWSLVCLVAASCSLLREPPPAAPVELAFTHFPGTSLSGPMDVEVGAADPWKLTWRARELRSMPAATLPLSTRTRWVVVEEGGDPLETHSALAANLTLLSPGAAPAPSTGDARLWSDQGLAALYAGTTFSMRTSSLRQGRATSSLPLERVAIEVSRLAGPNHGGSGSSGSGHAGSGAARDSASGGLAELTLVLEGRVPQPTDDEEAAPSTQRDAKLIVRRERVLLDLPIGPDAAPARIAIPLESSPFDAQRVLLVELDMERVPAASADEGAFAEATSGARELLSASAERARERASSADAFQLETRGALSALGESRLRRSALVFLTGTTGAPLAGDLALVTGPESLAGYHRALREALAEHSGQVRGAETLAWLLESTAYRWLAGLGEKPEAMPPELRGLFLRHAGELASYPDLVLEALAKSTDVENMKARLLAENRIFLEDGHPAARVRAFDWLSARGAAPEGFDPLGPREERRAILREANRETVAELQSAEGGR